LLLINYCKEGKAHSDFEVQEEVQGWVSLITVNPEVNFSLDVSTENIFYSFKLAVANDQIPIDNIKFLSDGVDMKVNEFGAFQYIPKEFGIVDHLIVDHLIVDLVRQQSKKRVTKRQIALP